MAKKTCPQVRILGKDFIKIIFEGTRLQLSRVNGENPDSPILVELVEIVGWSPTEKFRKTSLFVFVPEGNRGDDGHRLLTFPFQNEKARDFFLRLSARGETLHPWPEKEVEAKSEA